MHPTFQSESFICGIGTGIVVAVFIFDAFVDRVSRRHYRPYPMPDSGAKKLSPRESAELRGDDLC